ncbi:MAG TPA: IPT/TIG domain-containing protein [Thermoanaerobaculia bacterium]|nr:IPT/TIG domain-containing protein [Thermoanaerobaculia bacterium]
MNFVTRLLCVLVPLAAFSANAANTIRVEPPDPTSTTPIVLFVTEIDTCPPEPVVTRSGFTITVSLGGGMCLPPPAEITHRLELGPLPAGTYTVNVTDPPAGATATFVVLDANEDDLRVYPSTGKISGSTELNIQGFVPCPGHPGSVCPTPQIFIGGTEVTPVTRLQNGSYKVFTPPHAAGPVEIRLTNGDATLSGYAFRYIDPAAAPIETLFEKVLIPVVYNGPGANGSQWRTELAVRNLLNYPIEPWRPVVGAVQFPERRPLVLDSGSAPAGVFAFVPREAAASIHYNARIRDVSRESQDWGTELPVVRASEVKAGPKELMNIPLDARFRHTLRLYSMDSVPTTVQLTGYAMGTGGGPMGVHTVQLNSAAPCTPNVACASDQPAFAVINDLRALFPHIPAGFALGISIEPQSESRVWGFVTVTNNETQHVTVISPYPAGGR